MKHFVVPHVVLILVAALLAMGVLSGCGYDATVTPLPPVTAIAPAAAVEPATQAPAPAPTAMVAAPQQPAEPTAYPIPVTSGSNASEASAAGTPWSPYPAPEQTTVAQPIAGSEVALSLTILHVNDVYGEIDPCG